MAWGDATEACSVEKSSKRSRVHIRDEYRPATSSGAGGRFANQRHPEVADEVQSRILQLRNYARYQMNKDKPDATYEMLHPFEHFCKAITVHDLEKPRFGVTKERLLNAAKERLADISLSSDAFIETPTPDSHVFPIWGTEEEVSQAKTMLQSWEMHVKGPGRTPRARGWTTEKAFDGREEHRSIRSTITDLSNSYFQQSSDRNTCPYTAYLVWPEGYDFEQFVEDYEKDAFDAIRRDSRCVITHDMSNNRTTKVGAESEDTVLRVYDRLICLAKEMVARRRKGIKSNQCRFPSTTAFRQYVSLENVLSTKTSEETAVVPRLVGQKLHDGEIKSWEQSSIQFQKQCNSITKAALRSSISALHISEKHVKLRIFFGDFALTKYKRPQEGHKQYTINEFISMIQNKDVQMQQLPLLIDHTNDDRANFRYLTDEIDSMDRFGQPQHGWTCQFDFGGGHSSNTLRLETDFSPSYLISDAPERSGVRWLILGSDTSEEVEDLLEINIMDFERVSYCIRLGAVKLFGHEKIGKDLQKFEDNVRFVPQRGGLKSSPRKQAIFPPGNHDLRVVREINFARYPFKDTGGILELQRIDIYSANRGVVPSTPHRTEWSAAYFYHGWDSLLSMIADLHPGEETDWIRDLSTFFPRTSDVNNTDSLPNGFKSFMKEVEEVQDLLTLALQRSKT